MSDVSTTIHTNDDGSSLTVQRTQDVEPYLEENKAAYAETPSWRKFDNKHAFHKVASIPLIVAEQWMKEGINVFDKNDRPKIIARLNSPEYSYLRTKAVRL